MNQNDQGKILLRTLVNSLDIPNETFLIGGFHIFYTLSLDDVLVQIETKPKNFALLLTGAAR